MMPWGDGGDQFGNAFRRVGAVAGGGGIYPGAPRNGGINPGGRFNGSYPPGKGPGSFNPGAWDRSNGGGNPGGMYGGGVHQRTPFPFPKDSPEGGPPPMADQGNFLNSGYGWPRKWKPFGGPGDSINRDFQTVDPSMGPYGRPYGNGGINPGGMYDGGYGEGHTNGLPLHDRLPGGVDPNMGPYGRPRGNGGINPGGRYNGGSDEGQTNGLPLHDRLPPGPPMPPWVPGGSDSIFPPSGNRGPLPPSGGPVRQPVSDPPQPWGGDFGKWLRERLMPGYQDPQIPTESPISPTGPANPQTAAMAAPGWNWRS